MSRIFLIGLLFGLIAATAAPAQNVEKIAAVVNDEVISDYDLQARLSLVISGSRLPDTPEVRRRLAPQVLRRLIDETLELQEAKRLNIDVTDADLQHALNNIATQNDLPPGGLDKFLAAHGINKSALISRLEPEIAWAKVVNRRLRPEIQVSPEEINEVLANIEAGKGKPEYLLSEIFLRVDDTTDEKDALQMAHRIMQQIRNGGNFAALAHNFSQAASAANGGNLGWVRADELGDAISAAVSKMKAGQIGGPVRTLAGVEVLYLRKTRIATGLTDSDVTVQLHQLFFPIADNASDATVAETTKRAAAAAAGAKSCADMTRLAEKLKTPMSGSLGTLKVSSLPPPMQDAIDGLAIGHPSNPVRTANGVVVLMVCQRKGDATRAAARQKVERMLTMQRLDAASRRYLRDLRRAAFIDIRR